MALPATGVLETRTTGSDLNSGGFKPGGSGTDRSQSDTPFVTFDGATITASTSGTSATITITGYTVVSGDVDNFVRIAGGSGFTTGLYHISSVNTGANTWTLDRNCCSGASSGMTGRMGGATATFTQATTDQNVAGITIHLKSGTYSQTTGATMTNGSASAPMKVIGYQTTRGDYGSKPIIRAGANSITLLTPGSNAILDNIEVDGNRGGGYTSVRGISFASTSCTLIRAYVHSCTNNALNVSSSTFVFSSEIDDNVTQAAITNSSTLTMRDVKVHGGTVTGVTSSGSLFMTCCQVYANTGASSDGIAITSAVFAVLCNLVVHGNGRDGIRITSNAIGLLQNCIITSNTGTGLNASSVCPDLASQRNFYWNNGTAQSGTFNTSNPTADNNDTSSVTADPYTNASGGDFTVNATAGAGAVLRAAGTPGYLDIGALQHRGRELLVNSGMTGGIRG